MKFNSIEELKHLQALLKIEQEEDRLYYRNKILRSPLKERKAQGICWYPVVISEEGSSQGGKMYLELERTTQIDENHQFHFGKVVSIFSNNSNGTKDNPYLSGVITAVKPNKLKINFNIEELPDWVDDGKLGIDLLFDEVSYREMAGALNKVINPETKRLEQLREILLGNEKAKFNHTIDFQPYAELNDSQNKALIKIAQAEDVAIVHGPPGTGKTTTLVRAIIHTLKSEKQVLVCAPSNSAIDLLTEKLSEQGVIVVRIGNPARISENLFTHTLDNKVTAHQNYKELKQLKKNADEYRRLAAKYKRHYGREEREQRKRIISEARKLENEAGHLEFYMMEDVLSKAEVICATLVGSAHSILRDRQYKTVFIDEAAQALEPASWIPILRAQRVVFAGDHKQLPPTVKSAKAASDGLNITLFEKVIERQEAAIMLRKQYRMHEKIMNFSNAQFYENGLEADEKVASWVLKSEHYLLGSPVEFIDTAGCSYDEKFDKENVSLSNPDEAVLLFSHLTRLMEHIQQEVPEALDENFSVGIIAPYKSQVTLLKEMLLQHEFLTQFPKTISINTVDGFQGQERDVIYISMVRSNDRSEIGFLSDIRRMNVALTRARKKLVVIGDSATLGKHIFYRDFLEYAELINAYKSAWEYITA